MYLTIEAMSQVYRCDEAYDEEDLRVLFVLLKALYVLDDHFFLCLQLLLRLVPVEFPVLDRKEPRRPSLMNPSKSKTRAVSNKLTLPYPSATR